MLDLGLTALASAGISYVMSEVAPGVRSAAVALAGDVVKSVAHKGLVETYKGVRQRIAGLRGKPEGDAVAKAVRLAQLQALESLIGEYRTGEVARWKDDAACRPDLFFSAAGEFLATQLGRCRDVSIKMNLPVTDQVERAIDEAILGADTEEQKARALIVGAEDAVLGELVASLRAGGGGEIALPDGFEDRFRGRIDGAAGWFGHFAAFVRKQIAENDAFAAVYHTELLVDIKETGERAKEIAERTEGKVDGMSSQLAVILAEVRSRGTVGQAVAVGMSEEVVLLFARRMYEAEGREGSIDLEQAVKEVERAVEIAIETIRQGHAPGGDEFIRKVLQKVAEQTKKGAIDDASAEVDQALADLEAAEGERRTWVDAQRVHLLDAGIRADLLRFDVDAIVARMIAVGRIEDAVRPIWTRLFIERWWKFLVGGRDDGLNFDLHVAIALARIMKSSAGSAREERTARSNLGNSLSCLGRRSHGTNRLVEAVEEYRGALELCSREADSVMWARTQSNLGNALWELGQRESGTQALEDAVSAQREALEECTREERASMLTNLGAALSSLARRVDGTEQLKKVREVVAVYEQALKEQARELEPKDWALTLNNLGNALVLQGGLESQAEVQAGLMERALSAFHDALTVRTRNRFPMDWAATQSNLGGVLVSLGWIKNDPQLIVEAVVVLRGALSERTRDKMPFDWAVTSHELGNALASLGGGKGGTSRLEQAAAIFREVKSVFEAVGAMSDLPRVGESLDRVEKLLAERKGR